MKATQVIDRQASGVLNILRTTSKGWCMWRLYLIPLISLGMNKASRLFHSSGWWELIWDNYFAKIAFFFFLNGKYCTRFYVYFSPFVLVSLLNIIKVFHGICESQIKNWDCKWFGYFAKLVHTHIYIYLYLNGAKDCTHNKTYFSPFSFKSN